MYVDLHGLHPEEALEYLEKVLLFLSATSQNICYAITGTGHHSKGKQAIFYALAPNSINSQCTGGKDKVGKSVRGWLGDCGYVFREFSVPGERGGYIGSCLSS